MTVLSAIDQTGDPPLLSCIPLEELACDSDWWRIYDASFPAHEREPRKIVVRGIECDVALVSRISLAGRTVGVASAHLLIRSATVFLVYLAIDQRQRGHNLGTTLWKFAWETAAESLRQRGLTPRGMIWEVDSPGTADSPAEALVRLRRIRFFQHMGGNLLPHTYVQPPVNGVTVPMDLMFHGCTPTDIEVRRIIQEMYFEKYEAINRISVDVLRHLLERCSV